ncbi:MAG: [FeFe] hydrogenase H-cluster maturation GTPase HydF [Lachnospiraceae bacterium]|nr:[FeFe] hydrogenase H-cluster maturation GTPase HydF [Lachnospiraceae bacterium]
MGLNDTPRGERLHIALFGRRNAGKSSVINALTGQETAIVSETKGTTTDPVYKAMEILPLGPVVLIDTPGIDDAGELGMLRVSKTKEVLEKTDVALLVVDVTIGFSEYEEELMKEILSRSLPVFILLNKMDLMEENHHKLLDSLKNLYHVPVIAVSSKNLTGIREVKELLGTKVKEPENTFRIVGDLISPSDFVVLVVPIDKAAPKGRLILPQQQTIRDILESDATAIVVKEYELRETLEHLGKKPKLVITDSQVFSKVSADTPRDIMLTSFSILFARYKGNLRELVNGAKAIEELKDGDTILMAEGCTHHRQCDDIGTVKLPRWIRQYTGKELQFKTASGSGFPEDLSPYKMIVHCGGCTLNQKEMKSRIKRAKEQDVPMTNYGILISYLQGILDRCLEPFPGI